MYASYIYGDAGVTVTMTIKTFATERNEAPRLNLELFMAPPHCKTA